MARRVPILTREKVPEEHRAAYDELAGIRGRAPMVGPSSVRIHGPEMVVRVGRLSEFLGEQSDLSEGAKKLGALIAARSVDCLFVWNAHAAAGRRAELDDALMDALRDKKKLSAIASDEAAVAEFGQELTRTNRVSQKTFDDAVAQLGVRGLTEFTTLMGYYRMIALNANAATLTCPTIAPSRSCPFNIQNFLPYTPHGLFSNLYQVHVFNRPELEFWPNSYWLS